MLRNNTITNNLGLWARRIKLFLLCIPIDIKTFLRKHGLGVQKYAKLASLKDQYNGKRCFIIATGPSLTSSDILKLKNEFTFSMNAMCLKFEELNWMPTFYGIQDAAVFEKLKDIIIKSKLEYVFIDEKYRKELPEDKKWFFFPRNSCYNTFDAYFRHIYKAKFSSDPSVIVYDGFSITMTLLQIAVYLGFKNIYLLGCDCSYGTDGNNYFVSHGHVDPTYMEATNRLFAGYMAAKEFADRNNINIYNATRGGLLEIFPRVNLDDIV